MAKLEVGIRKKMVEQNIVRCLQKSYELELTILMQETVGERDEVINESRNTKKKWDDSVVVLENRMDELLEEESKLL